jgi:hypothetical protein
MAVRSSNLISFEEYFFYDLMLWSLVYDYGSFGGMYCFKLQGRRMSGAGSHILNKYVLPDRRQTISMHVVTLSYDVESFVAVTAITSNSTKFNFYLQLKIYSFLCISGAYGTLI